MNSMERSNGGNSVPSIRLVAANTAVSEWPGNTLRLVFRPTLKLPNGSQWLVQLAAKATLSTSKESAEVRRLLNDAVVRSFLLHSASETLRNEEGMIDRKSTRLNSSHANISY